MTVQRCRKIKSGGWSSPGSCLKLACAGSRSCPCETSPSGIGAKHGNSMEFLPSNLAHCFETRNKNKVKLLGSKFPSSKLEKVCIAWTTHLEKYLNSWKSWPSHPENDEIGILCYLHDRYGRYSSDIPRNPCLHENIVIIAVATWTFRSKNSSPQGKRNQHTKSHTNAKGTDPKNLERFQSLRAELKIVRG